MNGKLLAERFLNSSMRPRSASKRLHILSEFFMNYRVTRKKGWIKGSGMPSKIDTPSKPYLGKFRDENIPSF